MSNLHRLFSKFRMLNDNGIDNNNNSKFNIFTSNFNSTHENKLELDLDDESNLWNRLSKSEL